jgi:hypothetical protein
MTPHRDSRPSDAGLLKALALPDGPFKLYVWLRLNARPDTGTLETTQGDLSRALDKARGTIRSNLKALERAGVCRMQFPRGPAARGCIEIADDYWPHERAYASVGDPGLRAYLESVRALLQERACVQCAFSAADVHLARDWYNRGIPIERIAQAILLGCARKYVSWRNGARRTSIVSLRYFEPLLAELDDQHPAADYWDYTRDRIERLERQWQRETRGNGTAGNPPPAIANLENQGVSGHGRRADR